MKNNQCGWLSNGVYFEPSKRSGKSISIKSCCRIQSNESYTSVTELQNKQITDKDYTYANMKDSACKVCTQDEATSGTSLRLHPVTLRAYENVPSGKISLIKVAFSNFCNFKCRYCGPGSSTEWNKDIDKLNQNDATTFDLNIKQTAQETFDYELAVIEKIQNIDLSELSYLSIVGGEPFMTRNLEKFLVMLDQKADLSKVVLIVHTNGSVFPKDKILNILTKFKKVILKVSVEAIDKLAEYIRTGLVWEQFEQNVVKFKKLSNEFPNVVLQIHMTHNVYNLNKVVEFEQWLNNNQLEYTSNYAFQPDYTDVRKILTHQQREQIIENLSELRDQKLKQQLTSICSQDLYDSKVFDKFKRFTHVFDNMRSDSLETANKELYDLLFSSQ